MNWMISGKAEDSENKTNKNSTILKVFFFLTNSETNKNFRYFFRFEND